MLQDEKVIPVIYQPSVDALKNFVREVHCAKGPTNQDGSYKMEVSILFNNERLRQHGFCEFYLRSHTSLIYGQSDGSGIV